MRTYAVVNVVNNEVTAVHCFPGNFGEAIECAAKMVYEQDESVEYTTFDDFFANKKDWLTSYFSQNTNWAIDNEITVSVVDVE